MFQSIQVALSVVSGLGLAGITVGLMLMRPPDPARRARRDAREEARRIRRCRQTRALAALHQEVCSERHASGDVILFVDDASDVTLSIMWGLITYTREPRSRSSVNAGELPK
jgi:hypothetical protein